MNDTDPRQDWPKWLAVCSCGTGMIVDGPAGRFSCCNCDDGAQVTVSVLPVVPDAVAARRRLRPRMTLPPRPTPIWATDAA